MENLYKLETIEIVMRLLWKKLPSYLIVGFVIQSRQSGVKSTRLRLYIYGADTKQVAILDCPSKWPQILSLCFKGMYLEQPDFREAVVLEEDHPEVKHALAEFKRKAAVKGKRPWNSERDRHMQIRRVLEQHGLGKLPVPEKYPPLAGLASCEWVNLLPLRMRDSIYLHTEVACNLMNFDPSTLALVWDCTRNAHGAYRKNAKATGVAPCLLTTHTYFNTLLGRPHVGLEHLLLQGFQKCVRTTVCIETPDLHKHGSLTDDDLKFIAGNTISVPVIGTVMAIAKVSRLTHYSSQKTFVSLSSS
jgi:hypothetical protein